MLYCFRSLKRFVLFCCICETSISSIPVIQCLKQSKLESLINSLDCPGSTYSAFSLFDPMRQFCSTVAPRWPLGIDSSCSVRFNRSTDTSLNRSEMPPKPKRKDTEATETLTRIAIVNSDRCKPKRCRQECKKSCPGKKDLRSIAHSYKAGLKNSKYVPF